MTGQWVASRKKNARTGSHTVHFQKEPGMALCGRQLIRTLSLENWNPENTETCEICRMHYNGEKPGYLAIHLWVRSRIKQPINCPMCQNPHKRMVLHNIHKTYNRNTSPKEWVYLCYKCHSAVESGGAQ